MQNNINSSDLYLRLLEKTEPIKELTKTTQQFHSFLTFNNLNDTCNKIMLSVSKAVPRNIFLQSHALHTVKNSIDELHNGK